LDDIEQGAYQEYDSRKTGPAISKIAPDIDRSDKYCAKYQLRPSQGPYIVITKTYPDQDNALNGVIAEISFGGSDSGHLPEILERLQGAIHDADTLYYNASPKNVRGELRIEQDIYWHILKKRIDGMFGELYSVVLNIKNIEFKFREISIKATYKD
jgi:hypothetical protein